MATNPAHSIPYRRPVRGMGSRVQMLRVPEYVTREHVERRIQAVLSERAKDNPGNYAAPIDRAEAYQVLLELIGLTTGRLLRPIDLGLLRLAANYAPPPKKPRARKEER